jgi:hypothetical protein
LSNNYGAIKFKNVIISDATLRRTSSSNRSAPSDDRPAPNAVAVAAKKVAAAAAPAPAAASKPDVAKSAAVQKFFRQAADAKPKSSAATTSKASVAAGLAPVNISASQPAPISQAQEKVIAAAPTASRENVTDDGEWNDQGEAYNIDKSNLKKRKSADIPPTRHSREVEESEELEDSGNVSKHEEKDNIPSAVSFGKYKVHGAMDDFMEDIAIQNYIKAQEAGGEQPKSIAKKRKLVPKVRISGNCEE